MDELRELILAIVRSLVEDRGAVRLRDRGSRAAETVELEIQVADIDRGRLIGRRGQTIDAVRQVVDDVARRHGLRCRIEVA